MYAQFAVAAWGVLFVDYYCYSSNRKYSSFIYLIDRKLFCLFSSFFPSKLLMLFKLTVSHLSFMRSAVQACSLVVDSSNILLPCLPIVCITLNEYGSYSIYGLLETYLANWLQFHSDWSLFVPNYDPHDTYMRIHMYIVLQMELSLKFKYFIIAAWLCIWWVPYY